ncbi:PIG-L family deacetylase [Actinocorallia lasiicapitis]
MTENRSGEGAAAGCRRALVVCAHPDDVDFGAGGTVAAWVREGVEVSYLLVTDGDAGGDGTDRAQVALRRRLEQVKAAAELGVSEILWLGRRDGEVEVGLALREEICRVIRRTRPDRIVTHSPERDWNWISPSHPDHLATGEAVIRAVYPDARTAAAHARLLVEEGLQPWTVPEVWMFGGPVVNRWVDVTDTVELKLAALHAHESQVGADTGLDVFIRKWLRENAEKARLGPGTYAEGFFRAVMVE